MIESYINQMQANNLSPHTVQSFITVLKKLNNFKPVETITKNDLIIFFKKFEGTEESLKLYQVKIKKFYIDNGKPEIVDWIKVIKPKEKLRSDDILTTDDINKLIEGAEGAYWKAIITFLYESGVRISEAQSLKIKDFKETSEGLIVDIPTTKTASGFRRIILIMSADYIRNLKAMTNLSDNDILFHTSNTDITRNIKQIAIRAGINKPVNPHAFRHASANSLVQEGYNESIIRLKMGWSKTSNMIGRYTHLNDNAVVDATINKNARSIERKPITEIKQAEKLNIVDASRQFSKLKEDLERENERNKNLESKINDLNKIVMKLAGGRNEKETAINLKYKIAEIDENEASDYWYNVKQKKELEEQEKEIELAIKLGKTPPERKKFGYVEDEEGNFIIYGKDKKELFTRDEFFKRYRDSK